MSERQEPLACEECSHPLAKLFQTEHGWLCQRCWDEYEEEREDEYWREVEHWGEGNER